MYISVLNCFFWLFLSFLFFIHLFIHLFMNISIIVYYLTLKKFFTFRRCFEFLDLVLQDWQTISLGRWVLWKFFILICQNAHNLYVWCDSLPFFLIVYRTVTTWMFSLIVYNLVTARMFSMLVLFGYSLKLLLVLPEGTQHRVHLSSFHGNNWCISVCLQMLFVSLLGCWEEIWANPNPPSWYQGSSLVLINLSPKHRALSKHWRTSGQVYFIRLVNVLLQLQLSPDSSGL